MRLIHVVMLSVFVHLLSGCASTPPNLRADAGLQEANPMNRIALLGSSSVFWPRMGGKASIIGAKSSRAAIENVMPFVKGALEAKGYEVVFAEPVVVGFPVAGRENLVYADYDEFGEDSKWTLEGDSPVHIYPEFEGDGKLAVAAVDLLRDLDKAIQFRKFNQYAPKPDSVRTVADETGADTVCVLRTWGHRYSKARAVGALFAAMLGVAANASDRGEAVMACISPETGDVLWQRARGFSNDPMDVDREQVDTALAYFPDVATSLTSDCEVYKDRKDLFVCD